MTQGGQKLGSASRAWQDMTPAQVRRLMLRQPCHAWAALFAMPCLQSIVWLLSAVHLCFACQCLQRFTQLSVVRLQRHLLNATLLVTAAALRQRTAVPTSSMCSQVAWRSGCSVQPAVPSERPCQCPLWVQAAAAAAERRACDEVCCATRMGIDEDHAIVIEDRAEELGGQDPAAGQADSDSDVVILADDPQLAQHEPAAHAAQAPDQIAVHYDQARGKAPAPTAWDTSTAQQARCEGHATDTYSDPTGGMAALMPGAGLPGSSRSCLASASLADHHTMHWQPLQAVQTSACDSLFDDDILDLTDD